MSNEKAKKLVIPVEVLEHGIKLRKLVCKTGEPSAVYWTSRFLHHLHYSAREPLREHVEAAAKKVESEGTGIQFEISGRGRCENCGKKLSMKYSQCASCADERGP